MLHDDRTSKTRSDKIERKGLMAALDASQALVWFDPDGRVVDVNDNAVTMFGYAQQEFIRLDFFDLCGESASSRRSLERQWLQVVSGERCNDERNFMTRDGKRLWASVSYAALRNEYNLARRVVAIFIDLTPWSWKPPDTSRFF
ncbi:MAG: PAS domain-containing protein [Paracoccaceae bacterium]